jgi:AcrR family transcriptional regulator
MKNKIKDSLLRENCRNNILKAAIKMIRKEGWNVFSMRNLAEAVNYTAPVLYSCFSSKDELISALVKIGFKLLSDEIENTKKNKLHPLDQLTAMWLAYYEFGKKEKALYQAMFGLGISCPESDASKEGIAEVRQLFMYRDEEICTGFYLQWAAAHGLISLSFIQAPMPDPMIRDILNDTVKLSCLQR